jgi:hypothetical protein
MGVVLNSRPSSISSAYLPVEYNIRSTFTGVTGSFTSVRSDASGRAILTVEGFRRASRTFRKDGVITLENSTNYDGEFTVISSNNSGDVVIDTDFIANDSGSLGYSRLNAHVICDLYIDGSFVVQRVKYADINDEFVFDFSKEIQINLGNDLSPLPIGTTNPLIGAESSASVYIEYSDAQDVITNGIAETIVTLDEFKSDSVDAVTAINSTVPYLEWLSGSTKSQIKNSDTDLSAFLVGSTSGARFLTNSPTTISIGRDDSYQLSCIIDYSGAITYKRNVKSFDSTGAQITNLSIVFTPGNDSVWGIPAGTRDLPGVQVPSNAAYYEVSIVDVSNNAISETFTFNLDDKCYQSKTRFTWLNPRGGYDTYSFYAPRKLNASVSKGSFTKSPTYPTVIGNREDSIINVNAKDSISTRTAKVSSENAEWLQELLESPEVFIELDSSNALHGNRIPVAILNKTRAISNSYEALHTVSLRYTFGFSKIPIRAN